MTVLYAGAGAVTMPAVSQAGHNQHASISIQNEERRARSCTDAVCVDHISQYTPTESRINEAMFVLFVEKIDEAIQ